MDLVSLIQDDSAAKTTSSSGLRKPKISSRASQKINVLQQAASAIACCVGERLGYVLVESIRRTLVADCCVVIRYSLGQVCSSLRKTRDIFATLLKPEA